MAIKKFFFGYGTFSIKDRSEVSGLDPLPYENSTRYCMLLYVIRGIQLSMLWSLIGPRLISWEALLQRLANVQLTNGNDEFGWNLHEW
jgi:hypothetical protein